MLYHDDSNIIILVTTRSESVAERICTNLQPYKILPLTNNMCWDIIKQTSGFEARDDKEKLRGIGQEIAQKCAGVALAAQSLGFTLRGMNFDQWMKVKDSDIWKEHISKDISVPNHVVASLMLSYSYMDLSLKQCFTYCATFPKGSGRRRGKNCRPNIFLSPKQSEILFYCVRCRGDKYTACNSTSGAHLQFQAKNGVR